MKMNAGEELITRITNMERCFDEILESKQRDPKTFLNDPQMQKNLANLMDYYENGQWLRDYECDERGEVPQGLKRGVLSQDALFELLEEISK